MRCIVSCGSTSFPWLILFAALQRGGHDSQAYTKMDVTRERISHILELREMFLSIQTGFSLVDAAVVCAILECISGLEPLSDATEPRYLKLVTVSSLCPFTLISLLMLLLLFVNSLVFLALAFMLWVVEALLKHLNSFASSSSSPAKPLTSSAKQRLMFVLPPMLSASWWPSHSYASVMILSRNMLKWLGENRHPYQTLTVVQN